MTRRRVLYTLAALTAPILILWAQHARDHATGWYDPVDRRLTWHGFPRCLP